MSVIGRIGKTIFEKREHISSPSVLSWLKGGFGDTYAGEDVSAESAIQLTAVWACVKILAETLASLPLIVYKRLPNGGKERASEHSLYSVLHDLANVETTSFIWRETAMGHLATWGNSYSEIEYDLAGRVLGLWPLRPDKMQVERKNGQLTYTYRGKQMQTENVLHIPGMGYDGVIGYSPIQQLRNALGLTQATERYGSTFFKNGARPGGVLKYPKAMDDKTYNRLRESWEHQHEGTERASRVAILEEGMDYISVGLPPEDSQFLETRKFQLAEIARIYRVPPHMLADLDKATFSNIEHQSLEFVIHTVRPWLVRWEQELSKRLLTVAERKTYFVEFLVDGLLRGDIKSRYDAYAIGRQWGWFSTNDVRALENMNPIPNGNEYLVPMNMIGSGEKRELSPVADLIPEHIETRYGAVLNRKNKGDLVTARDLVDGVIQRSEPATEEESERNLKAGARVLALEAMKRVYKRAAQDIEAQKRKRGDDFPEWLSGYSLDWIPGIVEPVNEAVCQMRGVAPMKLDEFYGAVRTVLVNSASGGVDIDWSEGSTNMLISNLFGGA